MIRLRKELWCCLALLLTAAASRAQAPTEEPQVFGESIDVRVVNVETVVTDAKGARVRGLTAEDFRLLVDGKEVPVEYFTEVADGVAAGQRKGDVPAAGEAVGRSYLVYIDEGWAISSVRDVILERMERDLSLLGPADSMAILAFDGGKIAVLSGWTHDHEALAAALRLARTRPADGNKAWSDQRKLQADVDWVYDSAYSLDDGDNSGPSIVGAVLRALEPRISPEARTLLGKTSLAAASALRGFEAPPPGRKVMLLVSGAWSMSVAGRLYAPLIEAANRLGYTLYPVDAAKSDVVEVSALGKLAGITGGRVVTTPSLAVLRDVAADSGTYYWLGFTPSWKADDRGHRVTVEPKRTGLSVRARGGFSDLSPRSVNALKAESVLLFGGAESERRLIVRLGTPRRAGRGDVEIPVTLGVPVDSLALTPRGGGYVAETPLAVAAMDAKGGRAELPTSRLKVQMKALPPTGSYARFQTKVRLRDLDQRLVFTVRDPARGAALWGEADFRRAAAGRE
jgi:VWFA-related protein